ncbi:MAG: glycoside hydrolase family 5 protein [Candidatus Saccharimonadales bacterium]
MVQQIQQTDIASYGAMPNLSKSINITLWFRFPKEETRDYYQNYINDLDLRTIRNLGYTNVRLSVSPDFIFDKDASDNIRSYNLPLLDSALNKIINHQLSVIVDFHDETKDFEKPENAKKLVTMWGALSQHLSRYPANDVAFELLNEPRFENKHQQWLTLQQEIITTVRRNTVQHVIIVNGADWGSIAGLQEITPAQDKKLVYSFHFYEPSAFTHQGADWTDVGYKEISGLAYPSSVNNCRTTLAGLHIQESIDLVKEYCDQHWDKQKIVSAIQNIVTWRETYHVPLFAGEYGVYCKSAPRSSKIQWLKDMNDILAQAKIDASLWGYDDCFGLDAHRVNDTVTYDQEVARALNLTVR